MTKHSLNGSVNPYQSPVSDPEDGHPASGDSSGEYRMNGLWLAGLGIDTAMTFLSMLNYGVGIGGIVSVFLVFCIVGTILILTGSAKIGKGLFILGSLAFIPIGLVGVFGMRKADEAVGAAQFWSVTR